MEDFAKRKLAHAIAVELELRTQTIANDKVRIIKPQFNRSIILMNAQTVKLDHKQSCIIGEHVDRYPIDSVGLNEQLDSDLEGDKHFLIIYPFYPRCSWLSDSRQRL